MKGQVMTRRRVTRLIHLSPLCLAVVLAACGASADDELEQWMQQARSTVSTRLAPLPEPKPYAPREYTTTKQTDPFSVQKVAELSRAQDQSPEPGHRREPLEDYPLEAFKLLGTMKRNGESEAVLSVGDKTQHVHVGQYIGQNYGRIVRIGDQELTLRELVREGSAEWKEKMTTLKVQEGAQ
ncbi:pilus assembly protein PilP [Ralstonia pseudosolanacearum]|uniref:Pilus assembly protein PilP n=1 Tax=Ralstonia solanacearum TaxID=305 RepID=A0A0S4TZ79_RALSL|nr:pilus assembly protein PilP [Ralstonia pseudosolanacearum]OAI81527.1 pilus assembly protein PilP [Ralstonia solanacearum]QCX49746.1 pilus assembly protein PilP [Ralstonia pseudosolanacearum]CUV15091.1 putative fimbrial type-4 assembly lipoprotein [Ralstonia solanacearum]